MNASASAVGRALAGVPLRHRLVALVLALVTAGLVVAGVAAAAALPGLPTISAT